MLNRGIIEEQGSLRNL